MNKNGKIFYTRNVASFHQANPEFNLAFLIEWNETGLLGRSQGPWGNVNEKLVGEWYGKLIMLPLLNNQTTTLIVVSLMRWVFLDKTKSDDKLASATSNCLPSLRTPSIFSSFWLGALGLANLDFLLFLLTALLSNSTLISSKGSD